MAVYSYKKITPELGSGVFVSESADVIGRCKIGDNVSIWFNTVLRGDVANILVGQNTNIQDNSTLHITDNLDLEIGESVTIGHGVTLHSCKVGNFSLIGMGSVVLDKVSVGDFSLVAAGSVLPPGKVYGSKKLIRGNPAREIRDLREEEVEALKESARHYVDRKNEYLDRSVVDRIN